MKPLHLLSIVFLILGLIIAFVPKQTVKPVKLSKTELLQEIHDKQYFKTADEITDQLIQKDPSIRLVDIRPTSEFAKFSLPTAVNIPISKLLDSENLEIFEQDEYEYILFSNGNTDAVEAWLLLRQQGYQNIYVLQGGLNQWFDQYIAASKPLATSPDDELAKYDFRKVASSALGMGGSDSGAVIAPAPTTSVIKATKPAGGKKKKAGGGCS